MKHALPRRTWLNILILVALSIIFGGIGLHWILAYKVGQPVNIDEGGYLCIALTDSENWAAHGLFGFIRAVDSSSIQAPITTGITGFLFVLFGVHMTLALLVPTAFYIATIWVVYALADHLLESRGASLLTAILVACCPSILAYSRDYIFAVPAMFFYTLAVLALIKSEHFSNRTWAIIFGIACGLTPLARTVTIAFVPGLWLAALLYSQTGADTHKNFKIACRSIILSIFVALLWLVRSGVHVFKYLTSYGYGSHAKEYGLALHINLLGILLNALTIINESSNFLYFLVFMGALLAALLVCLWTRLKGLRAFAKSKELLLLICILEPLAALCSTRNQGTGFFVPVLPPLIALCVISLWRWSCGNRLYKAVCSLLLLVVAASGLVPALSATSDLARERNLGYSSIGVLEVTNGLGVTQQWEAGNGYKSQWPGLPVSLEQGHRWVEFSVQTARDIKALSGYNAATGIGFVHVLYNTGTVALEEHLLYGHILTGGIYALDPVATGNNVTGDEAWLTTGVGRHICILLTAHVRNPAIQPFDLAIDQNQLEQAAMKAGFQQQEQLLMPDGNLVLLWRRPSKCV